MREGKENCEMQNKRCEARGSRLEDVPDSTFGKPVTCNL
jgi:hypothetical protein